MEDFYEIGTEDLKITQPFRMLVAGPSSCGKSELIRACVTDPHLIAPAEHSRYYYPAQTLTPSRMEYIDSIRRCGEAPLSRLECFEGLPDMAELNALEGTKLIIIDDMFYDFVNSSEMKDLIVVHSHHADISVIITSQNYFSQGKYAKTMSRNMTDLILFDSKTDRLPFEIVSRHLFPGHSRFLPKVMDWLRLNVPATYDRYIYVDCHPNSQIPEDLRVRTNITAKTTATRRSGDGCGGGEMSLRRQLPLIVFSPR